jgi:hypothetical protein
VSIMSESDLQVSDMVALFKNCRTTAGWAWRVDPVDKATLMRGRARATDMTRTRRRLCARSTARWHYCNGLASISPESADGVEKGSAVNMHNASLPEWPR